MSRYPPPAPSPYNGFVPAPHRPPAIPIQQYMHVNPYLVNHHHRQQPLPPPNAAYPSPYQYSNHVYMNSAQGYSHVHLPPSSHQLAQPPHVKYFVPESERPKDKRKKTRTVSGHSGSSVSKTGNFDYNLERMWKKSVEIIDKSKTKKVDKTLASELTTTTTKKKDNDQRKNVSVVDVDVICLSSKDIEVIPKAELKKSSKVLKKLTLSGSGDVIAVNDEDKDSSTSSSFASIITKSQKGIELDSEDLMAIKLKLIDSEITLYEAIDRLNKDLPQGQVKSTELFAIMKENADVVTAVRNLAYVSGNIDVITYHAICDKIRHNCSPSLHLQRLEEVMKRVHVYATSHKFRKDRVKLRECIAKSHNSIEDGEDVGYLWDREISKAFSALLFSKYQETCAAMKRRQPLHIPVILKEFLGRLLKMWPPDMMTIEFLQKEADKIALPVSLEKEETFWKTSNGIPVSAKVAIPTVSAAAESVDSSTVIATSVDSSVPIPTPAEVEASVPISAIVDATISAPKSALLESIADSTSELLPDSSALPATTADLSVTTTAPTKDDSPDTIPASSEADSSVATPAPDPIYSSVKTSVDSSVITNESASMISVTVAPAPDSAPVVSFVDQSIPSYEHLLPACQERAYSNHEDRLKYVGSSRSRSPRHSRSPRRSPRHSKRRSSQRSRSPRRSPHSSSHRSLQRSHRHRSDESTDSYSKDRSRRHRRHSGGRSSHRSKRHSNDDYHSERLSKRVKYTPIVKEKTDFDRTLESFKVWDPLKGIADKPAITEVFQTKAPSVVNETTTSTVKSTPVVVISDSEKKSSEVLKERYGEIEIAVQEEEEEDVSKEAKEVRVALTVQGYYFEGVAENQSEAVEDASKKALILSSYLLKPIDNE